MRLISHLGTATRRRLRTAVAITLASLLVNACGLGGVENTISGAAQEASNAIGNAVSTLSDSSASWQTVLTQLEGSLSSQAKSLIDNDIQGVISRTIDHGGVEFRCDATFVNQQVADDLLAIKAKLLMQTPPVAQPQFCQADPEIIDLSQTLTAATFYGYNFDLKYPFAVKVEHLNGSQTDVPAGAVNIPTAYAVTVTLPVLGLGPDTTNLILYWNGQPFQSIGIVTPKAPTPVCATKVVQHEVGNIGPFFPPQVHNGGDQDFDGHGPRIQVGAQIHNTTTQVSARLYMDARETQSDWTEVQGYSPWNIVFTAEPGFVIDSVNTPTSVFPPAYVDNHNGTTVNPFKLNVGAGGLVNYFSIVGDTDGNDVGVASVAATFNHLTIVERQTGACVSAQALAQAAAAKKLSPLMLSSMAGKLVSLNLLLKTAGTKVGP